MSDELHIVELRHEAMQLVQALKEFKKLPDIAGLLQNSCKYCLAEILNLKIKDIENLVQLAAIYVRIKLEQDKGVIH